MRVSAPYAVNAKAPLPRAGISDNGFCKKFFDLVLRIHNDSAPFGALGKSDFFHIPHSELYQPDVKRALSTGCYRHKFLLSGV